MGTNRPTCPAPKPLGCTYDTDPVGNLLSHLDLDKSPTANSGKYRVTKFTGYNYCFGQTTGPTYFVPLKTRAEFESFYNNIQSGRNLPGLYRIGN